MEETTRLIPLTQNQVALVDADDFDWLNQWKWYATWNPCTRSFYAVRQTARIGGGQRRATMHREILGLQSGDPRQGDHRNRETLDNRKANLRIATRSENCRNRGLQINSTSGLKGIWPVGKKWAAAIGVNRKQIYLGCFDTPEEAHAVYCMAAETHHKDFARTA